MKKNSLSNYQCDVLIIGSGIAGLSLALRLSSKYKIVVVTKSQVNESATLYAQGGIAAVFNKQDSINSHIKDTLTTGIDLCDYDVVSFIVKNARKCINWLINNGISFDKNVESDRNDEIYHLHKEGGHSHRRILHIADRTGTEIENTLANKAIKNQNIRIIEYMVAIDLITLENSKLFVSRRAVGAWLWNRNQKTIETCTAKAIILATGGASKVYQYTTNPDISSGDGIAMAWRAGCRVANLEFNQFHPTCFFYPKGNNFLLTEALRGEGAFLIRPDKYRFMLDIDKRAELASRDIVSRAIYNEIRNHNIDCVYLDITHRSEQFIRSHFPIIHNKLLDFGFDLTKDIIPVVPAAHYTCGGVIVDKFGRTDLDGLYAIGEASYTGLHGANRLASNSLLECLVYSQSVSKYLIDTLYNIKLVNSLPLFNIKNSQEKHHLSDINLEFYLNKIRKSMWNNVGIIRTHKSLKNAKHEIILLNKEINRYYNSNFLSDKLLEVRNLVEVAELIIYSAIQRKESRGLHYICDYPNLLPNALPTILIPSNYVKK
ncbi:L-aspartate oxidase [Candidatus Pantoea edessiphila]|uniref:L-aspartate oxidase n=1 Tax=Candidatus Pantoea edessiphila TaxID=2044610 RepID=A0A2P5SYG1_9GAMM|nr:L-aspartate oxidase [Candidatus Pantoea edessiphila]MBK4775532.1 L-aspartate oxidase [Pantoea sp. Edef]PPI87342.1 L-aspartate oxidase [Candidatus Pantoea edessiphila]